MDSDTLNILIFKLTECQEVHHVLRIVVVDEDLSGVL